LEENFLKGEFMAQAAPALSTPAAPPPVMPGKLAVRPLEQRRLKLICSSASDLGNRWAIVVPTGVTMEMILLPDFWCNVSGQIRVADIIEVHADDRSLFASLYVREVGRARVSVALIQQVEFGELETTNEPASLHRTRYAGPHNKWIVERISDRKIVRERCETKEDAETALKAIENSLKVQ
jgi:hypothetical protein